MKRKIASFILAITLILTIFPVTGSAALKVGDPLGDVLYSDIMAYIDGKAIPTSIKSGTTMVVVEDLARYGFDVVWSGSARTLKVERNFNKAFDPIPVTKDTTHKPGTFKCKYVYTDIKSYLSGQLIESFAISGVTLIDFELLARYGALKWDGKARTISLALDKSAATTPPPTPTPTDPTIEPTTEEPTLAPMPTDPPTEPGVAVEIEEDPTEAEILPPPLTEITTNASEIDTLIAAKLISKGSDILTMRPFIPIIDPNADPSPTEAAVPPPPPTAPKAPSNLEIVSNSSQKKPKLTWQDNATDETEYEVRRYDYNPNTGAITNVKKWTLPVNSTSYIDNDAVAGKYYRYYVAARNTIGENKTTRAVMVYQAGTGNQTNTTDKGIGFLGNGYNVLGEYAKPDTKTSLRAPVLDWKKMVDWRQVEKITQFNLSDYFDNIAETAYDYCNKSTTKVGISGSYMGFSGSVNSTFGEMNQTSTHKYMATISYWVRLSEFRIVAPIKFDWANFVYPTVLAELNDSSIPAAKIIDKYGSHVLTAVRIGGRLDYNVIVQSQYNESFSSFSYNVKASFNAGFGSAGMKMEGAGSTASSTFLSTADRFVTSVGGVLDVGSLLMLGDTERANAIDKWRRSLGGPNGEATLCDFGGEALKPIWELCSTQKRSNEIKAEFEKRVLAQNKYPLPGYVTGLDIVNSKTGGVAGWNIAGPDMNSWGNSRYLFYNMAKNRDMAITDICAYYTPRGQTWKDPGPFEIGGVNAKNYKVTHNGNYGVFSMLYPDINYGAQYKWKETLTAGLITLKTVYHTESPGSTYLLYLRKGSKEKKPIKKIEVFTVPQTDNIIFYMQRQENRDWEYVYHLNEDASNSLPFNFNKGVIHHGTNAPPIYMRFLRGN